ncbi:MAG: chromosome partitioning protein ParB [Phototrophicaceae bacterium]
MVTWSEHGYVESDGENYYYWKARTLWKLAETMPIETIMLDSFDWESDNFECNAFSEQPLWREVGDQAKRIINADLQYPIVLSDEGNIMDGMHRVLKCYVFGVPSIQAVRFIENPPPDEIVPISNNA